MITELKAEHAKLTEQIHEIERAQLSPLIERRRAVERELAFHGTGTKAGDIIVSKEQRYIVEDITAEPMPDGSGRFRIIPTGKLIKKDGSLSDKAPHKIHGNWKREQGK